ncbi:MAG TPA: hypothetical protein VF528_05940 [Pyrinomonadaceae bacterium]|jgi:hypothetical protein
MRQEILQEDAKAQHKEVLEAMTVNAVNPQMNLESFLDDDYLKPQDYEEIPINSNSCSDRRGSTGHAWQK